MAAGDRQLGPESGWFAGGTSVLMAEKPAKEGAEGAWLSGRVAEVLVTVRLGDRGSSDF